MSDTPKTTTETSEAPTASWIALYERKLAGETVPLWVEMTGPRMAVIAQINQELGKDDCLALVRLVPVNMLALLEANGFTDEGLNPDKPYERLFCHPASHFFSVSKSADFHGVVRAIHDAGHTAGRRKIVNAWAQLQAALRL